MTDDDKKFEEWYEKAIWGNEDYRDSLRIAFLAALAIGREERTVAIAKTWGFADVGLHNDGLDDELRAAYPECFEEGDEQ